MQRVIPAGLCHCLPSRLEVLGPQLVVIEVSASRMGQPGKVKSIHRSASTSRTTLREGGEHRAINVRLAVEFTISPESGL
jgi:hypothetical protein